MGNNLMNNQQHDPKNTERLSNEEFDWICRRLSVEENAMIYNEISKCWRELAPLKSVPFFTGLVGAMYLTRLRFPNSWIGRRKPIPFYITTGFLSFIFSQFYVIRCCGKKNRHLLINLFKKHNGEFYFRKSRQMNFDESRKNEDISDFQYDETTPTISSNFEEMEEPTIGSKNE